MAFKMKSPLENSPYKGDTVEASEDNARHYKMMHADGKAANPHSEGVEKVLPYASFKMKGFPMQQTSAFKEHVTSEEEYGSASDEEIGKVIDEIRDIEKKLGTYRGPDTPPGDKTLSPEQKKKLQERRKYLYHLRETTHAD